MNKIYSVLLLFCCVLFCTCSKQEQFSFSTMSYADLLRIQHSDNWTAVDVLDAWHPGQVLHRYILVPHDQELPDQLPQGTLVRTPLQRTIVLSSVHGSLFCDLGCADQIAGMCDVEYIQSDSLRQRLKDHRMADAGSSMQVDQERLVSLRPDAFFVSPFENAGYGVLQSLNVPLIECADYMETSALGRAEWMKFFGLLMGCEAEADSAFAEIEKEYLDLCQKVEQVQERPTLLCDTKQGSAWYVPGGDSYIGRLFSDAGARYLFSNKNISGSVPLSFENVYATGHNADIWIIKYGGSAPISYKSLATDYSLYTQFRPWKERKIYGCNTFSIPFYEEIPFHPERLLRDLVKILHPSILPDYQLQYYLPLSE